MTEEKFMRLAIKKTREGIKSGQAPFGACIVRKGKVVVCRHNSVLKNTDITDHAEINAISSACKKLGKIDLSDCVIYSTTEPCPMCVSACHWARIPKIVYGARISDSAKFGFDEWPIPDAKMVELGKTHVELKKDFLRKECLNLFAEWAKKKESRAY
ncbi:MAG: nucleoside deaminase [Candidatus Micrarchaeia archaeon]|jgi:tRNA(Arg) A34 adenosine deaminase TadA